jgi:hypothetical protein
MNDALIVEDEPQFPHMASRARSRERGLLAEQNNCYLCLQSSLTSIPDRHIVPLRLPTFMLRG